MSIRLHWSGTRLMLGGLMVGEVREAGMMAGNWASYTLPGTMPVSVMGRGKFAETNAAAREECQRAVLAALAAAGVEAEVTP